VKTYSSEYRKEKSKRVPCNICGADDFQEVIRGNHHVFVRCNHCGLVYQNPQPIIDDLKNRYKNNYFEYEIKNEENFFNLMKCGLRDIGFNDMTPDTFATGNFLDIGCATGMLLDYMRTKGWDVFGVDICKESADYGIQKRGLNITIGTLHDADFSAAFFSIIHFSHLIEHVTDPKALLREVDRVLEPNGYAILTTPNIDGFQARLFKKRWRSAIPDHLYLFSKTTLSRLLDDAGFTIVKTVTWGGLAVGTAPCFIKRPIDMMAKRFGFGDVMLFLVKKKIG
jgi:2-polyprenyl-3-methyl-5-hydroxy-6-metoxy-1,4-benzoquinol methylase